MSEPCVSFRRELNASTKSFRSPTLLKSKSAAAATSFAFIATSASTSTSWSSPPRSLREARGKALLFPNAPDVLARLGGALLREGEWAAAADALGAAVRGEPADVSSRRELALALLQMGEIARACEASAAAVLYAPEDPWALEADARCEVARGNVPRALARISTARSFLPQDERLKAAQQRLEAELRGSNARAQPPSLK